MVGEMALFEIGIILALILLNGFFSMAELAVVSARPARLQIQARQGSKGAQRALDLAGDPNRFLSSVQIGITLIGILTGAFGGATIAARLVDWLRQFPALDAYAQPLSVGIVVVAIGLTTLIFGELVPKRLALALPEKIAVLVAGPLSLVATIGTPLVALLSFATSLVLRAIGLKPGNEGSVTEEEVRNVIAEGTAAGAIEPVERQMMEGVLRLADRPVRAVMVPRRDVVWIDLDDDPEMIQEELRSCPFSRLVVTRDGAIDEPLGVVQKKDLLDAILSGRTLDIGAAVREPLYAPEGISVLRLLDLFKTTPSHVAFVIDEFGSFQGLVTPTDVLEAIAGDLAAETTEKPDIFDRGDGSYLVEGSAALDHLARRLEIEVSPEADYHTAAGLVLARLGRIPAEGDRANIDGWIIEIVDMDGPRIDKLLFMPARPEGIGDPTV